MPTREEVQLAKSIERQKKKLAKDVKTYKKCQALKRRPAAQAKAKRVVMDHKNALARARRRANK